MTIVFGALAGAALLVLAAAIGYFYAMHVFRERNASKIATNDDEPTGVPMSTTTVSTANDDEEHVTETVTGHVIVDCLKCHKHNRVPYARLLKRPICGGCKDRLLPYRKITLETDRLRTKTKMQKLDGPALAEVRRVQTNYEKFWNVMHHQLFGLISGAERNKDRTVDEAAN